MSKFKTTHVAADGTPLYGEPINGVMRYWTKHAYDNFGDAYSGDVLTSVADLNVTIEAEMRRMQTNHNAKRYSSLGVPTAPWSATPTPNSYPAPAFTVADCATKVTRHLQALHQLAISGVRGASRHDVLLVSPHIDYCDDVCERVEELLASAGMGHIEVFVVDKAQGPCAAPWVTALALYDKSADSDAALELLARNALRSSCLWYLNDDGSFV